LSGRVNGTVALPSAPVVTSGENAASGSRLVRTAIGVLPAGGCAAAVDSFSSFIASAGGAGGGGGGGAPLASAASAVATVALNERPGAPPPPDAPTPWAS
jgi:hypothetical protein